MADILIHGISMPRERDHLTITINADGTVQPLVDMYCPIIAHAIELPEHGDLIDRDTLPQGRVEWEDIDDAPVVVPADKEESK